MHTFRWLHFAFLMLLLISCFAHAQSPLTLVPPDLSDGQGFEQQVLATGEIIHAMITAETPGTVTWPIISASPEIEAWILPLAEGHYIPADDEEWIENLVDQSPIDTTASLSMPWIALDLEGCTVTYIFENQFDNEITFENQGGRLAARVTHEFKDNWDELVFPVTVVIGEDDPIAPALIYRQWLIDHGDFVTMAEKIEALPRAERLLGAAQVYLFGGQALAREDIARSDWPEFCRRLADAEEGTMGHRVFTLLDDEARQAVLDLPEAGGQNDYAKGVIVRAISGVLMRDDLSVGLDLAPLLDSEAARQVSILMMADALQEVMTANHRQANCIIFQAEFSDLLDDPATWGDGYSTKMLDAFADAGLDRLLLVLDGYEGTGLRPNVASLADDLGYLLGSYDSYHSIHRPDADPDDTWTTAQFDWEAWENGCVMRRDGTYGSGFQRRGRHLSPLFAQPYVERRVNALMRNVPFSAWFIDCDAFGEFFDDYHPEHSANQMQDMEARLERMAWIRDAHDLVVGSEGGSAYAAPVIHYAHGIMTPGFGWGDERMRDRDSEYFLGAYYPPDGPHVFMDQVPLAPGYEKFNYDPRFRLPLYQSVFHDSVVATHCWGFHSLKFTDQIVTNALTEMLYQVPPMYSMNLREFRRHRDRMVAHAEFFSPLHRETGLMPLTAFEWLTGDRQVQRSVFGDRIEVIANFTEAEWASGEVIVPALSAWAQNRETGEILEFTSEAP